MRLRERIARRLDPKAYREHEHLHKKHRELWEDHLGRCGCHDSWDQCPCVEEGHHAYRIPWRGGACRCCAWCSPNRSGKASPFLKAATQ